MEDYQILEGEDTLVETSDIFEGNVVDSRDIEVADFETLAEVETEDKTATETNSNAAFSNHIKRKYSFVWQYFRAVEGKNQFQCLLCQSCVGSQTSNLARHLASTHDITRRRDKGLDLVRIRPSHSFIWKYCTKEDSKHARCHLCNKVLYCGGGNTANITKHLRRLHSDLIKETKNTQSSSKMDDETMQATASLSNPTPYEEDHHSRSSADIISERKERRGVSYVWSYVEKLSRHTIRCKLCTKVMSFHGTANVITHLQRRHNVLGEPGSQLNQIVNTKQDHIQDECETAGYNGKKFGRKSLSTASVVWKYCTRISQDQVRCCFCKKNLSYQGTSNLQRHLHRMHGVVTHGRLNKSIDEFVAMKENNFKLPTNIDFVWQFCTQEDDHRTKCNMCDSIFDTRDMDTLVKHLALEHSVETNQSIDGESKPIIMRTKKRHRHVDYDTDEDDDDYDGKWSKLDDAEDIQIQTEFDETNIKKDDSLYDDIIEEDHNNYDEEPFDPSLMQDMPTANPLSPRSSRGDTPQPQTTLNYQQPQQTLQTGNLLPPLETRVLLKLQEDRLRMETDYFREKAAYYRMQKYLTALQAKKARIELERLSRGEATFVATGDLNGAYVEVIATENHITT